jgi:HSP20 family protein
MRQTRWNPFGNAWNPLRQLQQEMGRLFDRWSDEGERLFGHAGYPALNVWEDNDAVYVEAELPGVEFKDVEVLVTGGNELTVKGERKPTAPESGVWHRQERSFGVFSRTVTLPFAVDADKVEAKLDNGVLQVRLAKHESARPRKIAVKAE